MQQFKKYLPILIMLLSVALCFAVKKCGDNAQEEARAKFNTEQLLNRQEEQIIDAQGRVTTIKQSLIMQADEFTKIKGVKDEQIRELQAAVKAAGKGVQAATVFRAVTKGKAAGPTDSIAYLPPKTVVFPSDTSSVFPTYYGTISGPGISGRVRASKDTVELLNYEIKQQYSVAFTSAKKGLFGKRRQQVQIKALNTGTAVEDVQSLQVPEPKQSRGLIFGSGAAVATILILLLL